MVGPKKEDFCSRINIIIRKKVLKIPTGNVSSSKIGHNFRKQSGSKIESRKNVFTKKWSPKLIFLNEIFFEKIQLIFDIEN